MPCCKAELYTSLSTGSTFEITFALAFILGMYIPKSLSTNIVSVDFVIVLVTALSVDETSMGVDSSAGVSI